MKWQRHDWRDHKAIYAYMPYKKQACVPISVARAFANNPTDDTEVGVLAGMVYRRMEMGKPNGIDRYGRFWGSVSELLQDTGFNFRYLAVKPRWHEYWNTPRKKWERTAKRCSPTAATFFREHPEILIALVGTEGHLGYYENGVGFLLGARYRVQEVWILKEKERNDEQVQSGALNGNRRRRYGREPARYCIHDSVEAVQRQIADRDLFACSSGQASRPTISSSNRGAC